MTEEFIEDILAETDTSGADAAAGADPKIDSGTDDGTAINNDQDKDTASQKQDTGEDPNKDAAAASADDTPVETVESIATKLGWNPDHKGEDFIDATTYILRSREIQDTMKDHNRELKNQLTNVQGAIESLKEHNERVYRSEIKRMQSELDSLKDQKRKAIELADVDTVDAIDKKIDDLQKDMEEPITEKPSSNNPVFDDWVKDNQWYLIDDDMAAYAETVAQDYKGAPLERIYKMVRKKVEEVFPEKFKKPNEVKNDKEVKKDKLENLSDKDENNNGQKKVIGPASPVESARKPGNEKPTFTKADLTPEQTAIMNQFVKSGVMTEEQYISDVAKMQEA
jgi:hypothetical protein